MGLRDASEQKEATSDEHVVRLYFRIVRTIWIESEIANHLCPHGKSQISILRVPLTSG